jgi:hypothetical protein
LCEEESLDLEDEGGELVGGDRHLAGRAPRNGYARLGRDRVLEEAVQEQLDPEVVHGAPEVHGRLHARVDLLQVEGVPGPVEHLKLLADLLERRVVQLRANGRVAERGDFLGRSVGAPGDALKEVHLL